MDLLDLAEDAPKRSIPTPPRPWRVALVHASAPRLLATRTAALARLGKEGFEVHVFAPEHPALSSLQARAGIVPRPLPGGAGASPLPTLASFLILQGAFAQNRFLIAHGEGGVMPWLAASCASQAEIPAVLSTIDTHDLPRPDSVALAGAISALEPYTEGTRARLFRWLGERSIPSARRWQWAQRLCQREYQGSADSGEPDQVLGYHAADGAALGPDQQRGLPGG